MNNSERRKLVAQPPKIPMYEVVRIYADGSIGGAGFEPTSKSEAVKEAARCVGLLSKDPPYPHLPADVIGYGILPVEVVAGLPPA